MLQGLRGTRRIGHEEQVHITDHLEELRNRLIISLLALAVGFGLCFWQHNLIIEFLNRPLPSSVPDPIVLGVAEPFTISLKVAAAGAVILAIPVLIYQIYAFVMPAFDPNHDRRTWPYLSAASALFFVGLAFGYLLVLPAALGFLVGYDAELYNRQVNAGDYYSFVVTILIACGLIFQLPTGVFVLSTVGLMRSAWMRSKRRYAIFGMSVVAAALPGGDVVSMLIILAALLVLYEASIYVCLFVERRRGEYLADEPVADEATTEVDAPDGGTA
jgi:sec-independent protein translocase protein TatC